MAIRFVGDLPKSRTMVRLNLSRIAKQLKDRPGEWAEIRTYYGKKKQTGYVYAHNCKTGKNRSLSPQMGFKVKAIADGEGGVVVHAAYVGLNGEHERPVKP